MWNYLWLSLKPPKFHGVKDHLMEFLNMQCVHGPYNDEFTENDHIHGNKEILMFGALRDVQSCEQAIYWRRQIINHPDVQRVIDEVSSNNKKRLRLSVEEHEKLKRRRVDVLAEVGYFIATQSATSDNKQICDY